MTGAVVLLWIVFAILGAFIFQAKNRPPWKGALLGLALGIIGLLIAACLSKKEAVS
jgi:H+/Cl- antiporter ClcA